LRTIWWEKKREAMHFFMACSSALDSLFTDPTFFSFQSLAFLSFALLIQTTLKLPQSAALRIFSLVFLAAGVKYLYLCAWLYVSEGALAGQYRELIFFSETHNLLLFCTALIAVTQTSLMIVADLLYSLISPCCTTTTTTTTTKSDC
jgi:hypothetical protein